MNNQLLLTIQREIFNYMSTFINDDITPPPYELLQLKDVTRRACQLLKEIEECNQTPSPGKLELIIQDLIALKKRKLIQSPHLTTMFSSLIEKLDDYYYLATCSLRVSA